MNRTDLTYRILKNFGWGINQIMPAGKLLGGDDDLQFQLMYLGRYEFRTVRLLKKILKPGDSFIDIGANIGYFCLTASWLVGPAGRVYAFEPDDRYYRGLKLTLKEMKTLNIRGFKIALGQRAEEKNIYQTRSWGMSSLVTGLRAPSEVTRTTRIRVRRLEQIITSQEFELVRLIKIDTEGWEFPVVMGMKKYIKSAPFPPVILMEFFPHALKLSGYGTSDLLALMNKLNYRVNNNLDIRNLADGPFNTYNLIWLPEGMKDFRAV